MLIVGAKGHAKEILQILEKDYSIEQFVFFDGLSLEQSMFFDRYHVLNCTKQVSEYFLKDRRFVLAVGDPLLRARFTAQFTDLGGELTSVIANSSSIGINKVILCEGLNVMNNVVIYNDTYIGKGTLLNTSCSIHHDAIVGDFCEISPGARVLGKAIVGSFCRLGANSVVLPDVVLGDRVVVGAGAVVTKNLPSGCVAVGVPAKAIKFLETEDEIRN
ncbi:MAG: acetyltransferase [Saprospirales bacterium]|nr:MAG: acetyltransferase [Saprospirales bacterium]